MSPYIDLCGDIAVIRFNPSQVTFEMVKLKAASTALGGSITVIDSDTPDEHGVYATKRIPVRLAVARHFIKQCKKVTKYLNPIPACVVRYRDSIIAIERHPLGTLGEFESEGVFDAKKVWVPDSKRNMDSYVTGKTNTTRPWYFDGRYAYQFSHEKIVDAVKKGKPLTRNGHFRHVIVNTIDLQCLESDHRVQVTERSCVAYLADSGEYAVSPPVWKNALSIATRQNGRYNDNDEEMDIDDAYDVITEQAEDHFRYDLIDERCNVNLNFVLKAGHVIGQLKGYDAVECLNLPRLMIELSTVNLPNIPNHIKSTYDTGMTFTQSFAWLLGMLRDNKQLETLITIKAMLKYLTTRALFEKDLYKQQSLFKPGFDVNDIPVVDVFNKKDDDVDDSVFDNLETLSGDDVEPVDD